MNNLLDNFGSNCFSEKNLKNRVPDYVYKKFLKIKEGKEELTIEIADIIANAIKMWALEKGTTHFTHWFQPLTELTAEKHESFISISTDGIAIAKFSGKELIKGESDTSSFPNGGLRSTFEARGYTAWDIGSPIFLKGKEGCKTLYIPTAFVSYNGEALDKKVPLLRSITALRNEVLKIQRLLGDNITQNVDVTLGVEQEYFLIDKNFFHQRQDLALSGRTVFGCLPPKGQEMNDHYYGTIKEKIETFMAELDNELWKVGVMSKTKHNEVAPNQFEIALMFSTANISVDQNQLTMDMIKKVANRHNLVALLHEKPFKGVNGSGKHCNWSISTDSGFNLYDPENLNNDNLSFFVYMLAMIEGIDRYAPLLRSTTATPGNDHRLGGHEAPPAIISIFIGEQLESLFENIENLNFDKNENSELEINLQIPKIPKDISDRNRTSPMAFTGNKFEFRMPGSSASAATPTFVLNTIIADVLREYADFFEKELKTKSIKKAIINLVKDRYPKHKRIIFNGNGYDKSWVETSKKLGLENLKNTVEGLPALIDDSSISLFERNNVLSKEETFSRFHVYCERYNKQNNIEISTAIRIARTQIYPFIIKYISELSKSIHRSRKIFPDENYFDYDISHLKEIILLKNDMIASIENIENKIKELAIIINIYERSKFYLDEIIPLYNKLRDVVDILEEKIASDKWPIPTYYDLLFNL